MNVFTNKLRTAAVGLALVSSCTVALAQDGEAAPKAKASKQENIGVVTGLAVGAAAGGPVGAILGAAAGGWLGERYHKESASNKSLQADLGTSESQRTQLAQNVSELNVSLTEARRKGDQLDLALKNTDELQVDVGFRTNDYSISTQAMPPLLKLGALAASMPDAKLRVAGFADSRGSDELNDALSRRRAEAVAAVLAQAGVAPERLIVEGHGRSESTAVEGDLDGCALDRKVTVRLERAGNTAVARNDQ